MSYVSEVADLVSSRLPVVKILSPADYALIAEWQKQEIPLVVVLKSINHIFDNIKGKELENLKLNEYFQNEVKKNFANWLQNQSTR